MDVDGTSSDRNNQPNMKMLYTPSQTAEMLGISRSQVYLLMNKGELDSIHIGRSRRIAMSHVDRFLNSVSKGRI